MTFSVVESWVQLLQNMSAIQGTVPEGKLTHEAHLSVFWTHSTVLSPHWSEVKSNENILNDVIAAPTPQSISSICSLKKGCGTRRVTSALGWWNRRCPSGHRRRQITASLKVSVEDDHGWWWRAFRARLRAERIRLWKPLLCSALRSRSVCLRWRGIPEWWFSTRSTRRISQHLKHF